MRRTRLWRPLIPLLAVGALLLGGLPPAAASPVSDNGNGTYSNPVIFADVPDTDVVYDGHAYYMVSTTMHMEPSVPIMKSTDMVNWSIVDYTAPILADTDALALRNGKNAYSNGTWAASIRFHNGTYYISVGSQTTGKTYIYSTPSIENGPWTTSVLDGYDHDQSLLFDGDNVYLVYGAGQIILRQLKQNADGTVGYAGNPVTLVNNSNVAMTGGLNAEGSHAYKIGNYYWVFQIEWPTGGIRQEVAWRSTSLTPQSEGGNWEGRVVFSQRATVGGQAGDGAAQGGVIQGADGNWYAMIFQDEGPVGRSPQLADVTWSADGWPQYTLSGTMNIPGGGTASAPTDIVASDEFTNAGTKAGYWNTTNAGALTSTAENASNGSNLKLQWQWNHNPDNRFWSLTARPGYLRLTTGSLATGILNARNTLTQRTYGPTSSGAVALDVSHLQNGDVAGLAAFQQKYGYVGVTMSDGARSLVMQRANSNGTIALTSTPVPLTASTVYLKVDTNYQNFANTASFYYSLDGSAWTKIGDNLAMEYTMPHFMGYRFGLFNYATTTTGGYVDFDYFHVSDQIGQGVTGNPCTTTAAIVDNGGFEAGALSPWIGNGTAQLALTTADKAAGSSSVYVTGRTQTGDGPRQSVADELTAGASYAVSAKVKYTTGPATKQFNVTIQDANYKAYIMATATVTKGQWTTLTGTYTIPTTGLDLTTARVFVETVYTSTPDADNDLMNFWADDVSMTGAANTTFNGGLVGNGGFEAGTLSPWTGNGAQLALSTADKADGACSVYVSGRTHTGDGPSQSLAGKLTAGASYAVSARVKYTTGPATKQFNVTVQDANFKAYIMASATVTKGQWATVSGSYTVPTTGLDLSTARVFVETVYTSAPDAANDLMDFWVDDVSVSGSTATTHPKGTAAPAKTVGNSNPLMDYEYGADPFALVFDGRVYEYMTGDGAQIDSSGNVVQAYETDASGNIKDNSYGKIQTIVVSSSADMVNWTNEGQIKVAGPSGAATWAANSWAPAAAHKVINGRDKFFLYFANSAGGIGVLQSDSPVGPWTDPIHKALVTPSTPGAANVTWLFDPAVLTDDDGTSYLYFGGGVPSTNGTSTPAQQDHPQTARVIRLGDDMVSTVGSAAMIDAPAMFEDSGINKIGDRYYYSYCTNFSHDAVIDGHTIGSGNIAYMVSDSPMGPFTYQGEILSNPGAFFGVGGNNHHAMFQFNGQWYITYHAQTLQSALVAGGSLDKAHGYRSTGINKVTVNSDGTIAPITMNYQGVAQSSPLDPYQRIEGETIAWDSGIQDAYDPSSGIRVAPVNSGSTTEQKLTNINNGEWTSLAGVDFGSGGASGATGFTADLLPKAGGQLQIRLDSADTSSDANLVGTVTVPASSAGTWQKLGTTLTRKVTGVHRVFFTFAGAGTSELFDVDDWQFTAPTGPVISAVSLTAGDVVAGTKSFTVSLAGQASDVSYTYIELNRNGAWVTDNTTAAAKALGSTNSGLSPKLVVDSTALPNGNYGLKIDAVGTNGGTTEKKIAFSINNAPGVRFVAPADGAAVSGTVPVQVALSSGQGLQAYNLRVDSAGLQYAYQPKAGTQTFSLDTTTLSNGAHTLLATATDTSGNTTTVTEKITVNNAPALKFLTPGAGGTVSGSVAVQVTLSGQGLTAYNLRVDSAGLQYVNPPKSGTQTFQLDTTTLTDGLHTLLATATDSAGNKSTITEKITVSNPAQDH